MFPTILVSNNQKTSEKYILEMKQKNGISDMQVEIITPEKTSITIGQVRDLRKQLAITTSKPRCIIFEKFDSSTLEAQNALLKVLEELGAKMYFIMHVSQIGNILPTIISRSRVVQLEHEYVKHDDTVIKELKLFFENPTVAFLSNPLFIVKTKDEARELLSTALDVMRSLLQTDKKYPQLLTLSLNLLYKLEHNNLSPQLTVDNFLIAVIKAKK